MIPEQIAELEARLDAYAESCLSGKNLKEFQEATGEKREELRSRALSAWMTPEPLAKRIVKWAGIQPEAFVLEPSCGLKSFVVAAHDVGARVTSIDINHNFVPDICKDFLECQFSGQFDWVLGNPPFEGKDCDFLEKSFTHAEDVVFVLRLAALAGEDRFQRVWKHVTLAGLVILRTRPQFPLDDREMGPPRSDFCVVHASMRDNVIVKPTEWW